jgi:hypothetical protein
MKSQTRMGVTRKDEVDIKKEEETSFIPKATGNGEDGG